MTWESAEKWEQLTGWLLGSPSSDQGQVYFATGLTDEQRHKGFSITILGCGPVRLFPAPFERFYEVVNMKITPKVFVEWENKTK